MWYAGGEEVDVKDSSEWFFADNVLDVVSELVSCFSFCLDTSSIISDK